LPCAPPGDQAQSLQDEFDLAVISRTTAAARTAVPMLTEYFDEDVASHPGSRIAGGRGDPHRCHDQACLDSAGNREQAAPMRTRLGTQTAAGQRPEGECPQRNQRGRNREAPGTGQRNPRRTTFPVILATNACPSTR
jgi:hypothetical protein